MELDEIDSTLLRELQRDGRLSYEALGQAVGLSRTAVRSRLDRLTGSGALRIVGVVHPEVLGVGTFAHVAVMTNGPAAPVAQAIAGLDEAPFVSMIAGRHGVIAELRCRDLDVLDSALGAIRSFEGVARVDTALYTRVVKDTYMPKRHLQAEELDEVDLGLLGALQYDGRLSFADLGGRVSLSASAARTRVLRLVDAGVVQIGALLNPTVLGVTDMCGFDLTFSGERESVLTQLAGLEHVNFLAAAVGRCDAVGTLIARTRNEIPAMLEDLRRNPSVSGVESWVHLDLVKERYGSPILSRPPGP